LGWSQGRAGQESGGSFAQGVLASTTGDPSIFLRFWFLFLLMRAVEMGKTRFAAVVLVLGLGLAVSIERSAEGRRRWIRRRTARPVAVAVNVWGEAATDQERCEAEAAYMAANGIAAHVGPTIGNFEGFGVGGSAGCATCVPRYGMTLTGDAASQSASGRWFRVRSWR